VTACGNRLICLIALFGSLGTEAGAITRGRVDYVRTIPSVREFTRARTIWGKLLDLVAGPPDSRPEIVRPYSLTHDSTGRLLIADPGQGGVHIFDFEKHKYQFLKGRRKDTLASPVDVVCDANDDIYVSDSVRARVFVFDSKGKLLRTIGGAGSETRLQRPTGMALDRTAGLLYLSDTLRHQVLIFRRNGAVVKVIGQRGAGLGEFNFPTSLTLSGDRLYVVDALNSRIQSFSKDGVFVSTFGQMGDQTGTLNRPKGIAADTDGNLYIADALFNTVQVFNPQGQLLYYFGSIGTKAGQFELPAGVSIDDRNIIYVADSQNRRVQVFRRWQVE
jgi:DNA-binding beta-propeller fold protein YncE